MDDMDLLDVSSHAGHETRMARTIAESDVYLFAGITGDLASYHVNHAAMKDTVYGGRIVHGVLLLGLVSAASSLYWSSVDGEGMTVSYGYDRVRFVGAVPIGETVEVHYRVTGSDESKSLVHSTATITDEAGETVLSAVHLTKVRSFQRA
jgi:3-hydroxybutyryl-CoA dehydratase